MSKIEIPEAAIRVACDAYDGALLDKTPRARGSAPDDHEEIVALRAAAPLIVAAELRRIADNLRAEAGDRGNGWRANETYRAQKIFTQLRERADQLDPEGGER